MKKTSTSRVALLLVAAAAAAVAPLQVAHAQTQPTAGDIAQARELYNQAVALRDKKDAQGALEKLKAAYALAQTPIIGLELGRSYVALAKLVEARETLLSVARIPHQPAETSRSTAARKESADLAEQCRGRIPSLTLKITGVPADSVAVTIDGAVVPTVALVAPRLVNPGLHKIAATSTSGGTAETSVTLNEGETREVELKIVLTGGTPAPPAPATPPSELPPTPPIDARQSGGLGPLVYVGLGTAAAGIVVGSVTGAMSLSKASSVKSACDGTTCPRSIDGDLQSGRTLGTVSTIAFAVAGAGAVTGLVGLLIRPHQEPVTPAAASVTPWIGVGAAGVAGTF